MQVKESQVHKLLSGEVQCKFSQLGFNMLLTRLATSYRKNPTPNTLKTSTNEINAFLAKFSGIMGRDYDLIARL